MTYLPVDNNCICIFAANGSNCHIRVTNLGQESVLLAEVVGFLSMVMAQFWFRQAM